MMGIGRTVTTWWQAARSASRRRVVAECVLTLFCAALGVVSGATLIPTSRPALEVASAILTGVATLVVVPLRLVRPVTAMILGSLVSVPSGGASLTTAVLSWGLGYRAKRPLAIAAAYLVALAGCVAGVMLQPEGAGFFGLAIGITLFALGVVLPGALAAMLAQRRLLVMTMQQRNLELHAERLLVAGQAQARERNRIAAELHDSLGHRLTLISLYAGGLANSGGSGPATTVATPERRQAVEMLRDTSAQAMSELRQILKVLHQDDTVSAAGRSLEEVGPTVAAARQTGTEIELVRLGEPRPLGLMGEHAAFRVVQEGITNALKHAAGAPIRVELRYESDALVAEVSNRPGRPSFGPVTGTGTGQGLHGLAERVRLAGGVLAHGSTPDGFRLGAMLPYDSDVPAPARPDGTGDFRQDLRRSSRRQRIGLVAVIAALLVSMTSCVAAIVVTDVPEPLTENIFRSIETGDSESRLDTLLPGEAMDVSRRPSGERCETYAGDLEIQPDNGDSIDYEICFQDGAVTSKREVRTKGTP